MWAAYNAHIVHAIELNAVCASTIHTHSTTSACVKSCVSIIYARTHAHAARRSHNKIAIYVLIWSVWRNHRKRFVSNMAQTDKNRTNLFEILGIALELLTVDQSWAHTGLRWFYWCVRSVWFNGLISHVTILLRCCSFFFLPSPKTAVQRLESCVSAEHFQHLIHTKFRNVSMPKQRKKCIWLIYLYEHGKVKQ